MHSNDQNYCIASAENANEYCHHICGAYGSALCPSCPIEKMRQKFVLEQMKHLMQQRLLREVCLIEQNSLHTTEYICLD